MRRFLLLAGTVILACPTTTALAQDEGDVAAFFALLTTPVGALPPSITPAMLGDDTGRRFGMRYGTYEFDFLERFHNIGVTLTDPRLGVSVAYLTCDGCDGAVMVGVEFDPILARGTLGGTAASGAWTIGLRPTIGYATGTDDPFGDNIFSVGGGLPGAIAVPLSDGKLVAFVEPGIGVGMINSEGESESGFRFLFGGGIGYVGRMFGVHAGFQKIFLEDAPTQWGVGFSFGL